MDYPEAIRSAMFDWYDIPPSTAGRSESRVKEVSPCSEYTRYTVEGVLKDPRSDLSVVLDVDAMGPIFTNSTLKDPKWSSKLGYGMAGVGEDTRIHIHRNGKFIVRRARDREHAESMYQLIVHMMKPALYDELTGRFLWDIIRERTIDNSDLEDISPLLQWPSSEIDVEDIFGRIRDGARDVELDIISPIREDLIKGVRHDEDEYRAKLDPMERSYSEDMMDDVDISLGRFCGLIWARMALGLMDDNVTPFFIGASSWNYLDIISSDGEHETQGVSVKLAQLHYLLSPVN